MRVPFYVMAPVLGQALPPIIKTRYIIQTQRPIPYRLPKVGRSWNSGRCQEFVMLLTIDGCTIEKVPSRYLLVALDGSLDVK